MCISSTGEFSSFLSFREGKLRLKRCKIQVHRLTRRGCEEKDIELKNLQLYLENQTIIEENEKLRKKACLLHQENLALMSQLQKRFPCFSTTIS